MELTDYLTAIVRHWRLWVAVTVLAVAASAVTLAVLPRSYSATAEVFVSAQPSIPNSGQYVLQRAQSYPQVATSNTVLDQVISDLSLNETTAQLRSSISATVPTGTSQIEVTATDSDPRLAAQIANSTADHLSRVVQKLETPASGPRPVTLSLSNPASTPSTPTSPRASYVLGLGLLVGLFLGLALAVLRSRLSTAVYDAEDARAAWGADDDLEVLAVRRGRAGRSALTGDPAAALARRLEFPAADRRMRVVVLSPAPRERSRAAAFAREVAAHLERQEVPVTVVDTGAVAADDARRGVLLTVGDPLASPQVWREFADRGDAVVLVTPQGRVIAEELREMRTMLRTAQVQVLAIVVTGRRAGKDARADVPVADGSPDAAEHESQGAADGSGRRSSDVENGSRPASSQAAALTRRAP